MKTSLRRLLTILTLASLAPLAISGCQPHHPVVDSIDKRIAAQAEQTIATQLNQNTDVVERYGELVSIKMISLRRSREGTGGFGSTGTLHRATLWIEYGCQFEKYPEFLETVTVKVFKGAPFQVKLQPSQEWVRAQTEIDPTALWVLEKSDNYRDRLAFFTHGGTQSTTSLIDCQMADPNFVEK